MLSQHPITHMMYRCGYNGIEDIYDYWQQHSDRIIKAYKKECNTNTLEQDLAEFRTKIRWGSIFGILLRFEINQHLRTTRYDTTDFTNVLVRFGHGYSSVKGFSAWSELEPTNQQITDLRGISILKQRISDITIHDVDFTYATLDACTFEHVRFERCIFRKTRFQDVRLLNCVVESSCIMEDNDFRWAVLDSVFDCDIIRPIVQPMTVLWWSSYRLNRELNYPSFTMILQDSFVTKSHRDDIKAEYQRQEQFRQKSTKIAR